MSRDGSGTYSLPLANVVAGNTILASWANTTLGDIEAALTASLAKDGQTNPSANLPMNTFRHTGVGDAASRTDYASAAQVVDGDLQELSSVSGTDTITATGPLGLSAYAQGQRFSFVSAGANTGAVTINISSIGAKAITKNGSTALVAGDIPSGAVCLIEYDGTRFQLINVPNISLSDDQIAAKVGSADPSGLSVPQNSLVGRFGSSLATLAVSASRIVGRGASGALKAMTSSEVFSFLGITATAADMNSVLTPYAAQRVELGGDFDAGEEIVCERIGNTVTITSVDTLDHSSGSIVSSEGTEIPAMFRPSADGLALGIVSNIYANDASVVRNVNIDSDGGFTLLYRDHSGTLTNQTHSSVNVSISFVITDNVT